MLIWQWLTNFWATLYVVKQEMTRLIRKLVSWQRKTRSWWIETRALPRTTRMDTQPPAQIRHTLRSPTTRRIVSTRNSAFRDSTCRPLEFSVTIIILIRHRMVAAKQKKVKATNTMLSPRQSSEQMILRSRGHSFDVPRVTYETTKRSLLMLCLYREKSVLLGLGCPADV